MRPGRRVRRSAKGGFKVALPAEERELLRSLPAQLLELLDGDDPSVYRLFPLAYPDDPERDAEFTQLTRDDLAQHHRDALATLERTVDATRLDEEEMEAWLGALNQLRLVLGTQLDVTEDLAELDLDAGDPRLPGLLLYDFLTMLQGQVIDALGG